MKDMMFNLNQAIAIAVSGEIGTVIARAEFSNCQDRFLVRYKNGTGSAIESWWDEDALVAVAVDGAVARSTPDVGQTEPTAAMVDSDGMPYDAMIHSTPPSKSADGTWRARKGSAEQAKAARAAFKAAGGNVAAPAIAAPAIAAPAIAAPAIAAPALPQYVAPAPILPPPVTFEQVVSKLHDRINSDPDFMSKLGAIYQASGIPDGVDPSAILSTNETVRAALFAQLSA